MSIKTIQIALGCAILLLSNAIFAQSRFQFGLGFVDDLTYLQGVDRLVVEDSIFFTNAPEGRRHSIFSDPSLSAYVKWSFLGNEHVDLSVSLVHSKKYTTITLWRTSDIAHASGVPQHSDFTVTQVRNAFFIPFHIGLKPFESLRDINRFRPLTDFKISLGGGPVFSDNALSPGDKTEFSPGLSLQRIDVLFTEYRHQFINQNQRIVTFDYSLAMETEIIHGLGVQALWSGSVGLVSKPIRIPGREPDIPLKRRSMHLFLTYSFEF